MYRATALSSSSPSLWSRVLRCINMIALGGGLSAALFIGCAARTVEPSASASLAGTQPISPPPRILFVDASAPSEGDGSRAHPFQTLSRSLSAARYGDTIRLAKGRYTSDATLVNHVTVVGAGDDQTYVAGDAYFALALRPFVTYFERNDQSYWYGDVQGVDYKDFTFDGGEDWPTRRAESIAQHLRFVMALDRENVDTVRSLLTADPTLATKPIHTPDANSGVTTPLHRLAGVYFTASPSELAIAQLLIDYGADVNATGGQARGSGLSALAYAGYFGDATLVELLLANGADPHTISGNGLSAVDATAHEGSHAPKYHDGGSYRRALKALMAAGTAYDLGHLVMLDMVDHMETALSLDSTLVNKRIRLLHDDDDYGTPLHAAATECSAPAGAVLLRYGADVGALDADGMTPLRRVLAQGDAPDCRAFAKLLLAHGAPADAMYAVAVGDAQDVAAALVADPNSIHMRDKRGRTLLDIAAGRDDLAIVQAVREAGGQYSQHLEGLLADAGADHSIHLVEQVNSPHTDRTGYLHLDASESLDIRDEITLAAWVYRRHGSSGTAIGKWYQNKTWSYVLHTSSGSGFRLHWDDGTQTNVTGFWLPYLEWVHYAATYDGTAMRVFVNGELVSESPVAGKRIDATDNPVWLGSSGYRDRHWGLLDEVQIWNIARTQDQIRASMREGLAGTESGLVAWFPFEDEPLRDRSPAGNHARLEGPARILSDPSPADAAHTPKGALWLLPSPDAAPTTPDTAEEELPPPAEPVTVEVPKTPQPLTVDGVLDEWDHVHWMYLAPGAKFMSVRDPNLLQDDGPSEAPGTAGTDQDLTAHVAMQWSDDGLYLAARVADNVHDVHGAVDRAWYFRDSVMLYLKVPGYLAEAAPGEETHRFSFTADPSLPSWGRIWRANVGRRSLQGPTKETDLAVKMVSATDYHLEAYIPMHMLSRYEPSWKPPYEDRALGFTLVVADADNGADVWGGQITYGGDVFETISQLVLRDSQTVAAPSPLEAE